MASETANDWSPGRAWLATHIPMSSDPAVLAKFWDKFIEKEWLEWHRETAAARAAVFAEFERKLNDPDAHCRIFNGLSGCFFGVLVWPNRTADFAAHKAIYRLHEKALRQIRGHISKLQRLNTVGRSTRLSQALTQLDTLATEELLGGPDDTARGPAFRSLHSTEMERPGTIATLVKEKRLSEMDWQVERLIASQGTGSSKRGGGRKGYAVVSLEATVMADIIEHARVSKGKRISRLQALLMVGRLLSAYLPKEYVGATGVRGMENKDRQGNERIGRPASRKKRA